MGHRQVRFLGKGDGLLDELSATHHRVVAVREQGRHRAATLAASVALPAVLLLTALGGRLRTERRSAGGFTSVPNSAQLVVLAYESGLVTPRTF
ncbi:hypothetical protein ACWEF9_22560 [Streptomyces sp. NPDC004980]